MTMRMYITFGGSLFPFLAVKARHYTGWAGERFSQVFTY